MNKDRAGFLKVENASEDVLVKVFKMMGTTKVAWIMIGLNVFQILRELGHVYLGW